jgi:hypothetical protein
VQIGTDEAVVGGREIWRAINKRGEGLKLRSADEATDLLRIRLTAAGLDGDVYIRKAIQSYAENSTSARACRAGPQMNWIAASR